MYADDTKIYREIRDKHDQEILRHEIFPEFSRPQRSFSWKSQIRFNIYGGGGGTIYSVCSLSVSNDGMARHKSSQASGVYTMSTFTSIYYNSLIFCIVCVCTSLLILKTVVCHINPCSAEYLRLFFAPQLNI